MSRKKDENSLRIVGLEEERAAFVPLPAPILPKMSFDTWWLLAQQRLSLRIELKEAVKKHLEARGFMKTGDFEKGLIDFGYRS